MQYPRLNWMARGHFTRRGFTLVELLVVVAIISVLAAVALPAYNNYTLKSRFTEVVSATNPIKTYVSSCVSDGSCVQNNQVYLDLSSPSVVISAGTPDTLNIPASEQAAYDLLYTTYQTAQNAGYTMNIAFADAWQDYLDNSGTGGEYVVGTDPTNSANTCILATTSSPYTGTTTACKKYYDQGAAGGPYSSQQNSQTTSFAPSSVVSYASISGYTAPVVQAAHAGTTVAPCVGSDAGCSASTKYVLSASVISTGVITATAQSTYQLDSNTFILTPSYSSGRVDWTASGSCKTRAKGALC